MQPLRIFIGYDHRQPVSYAVLTQSILSHATVPVSVTPLVLGTLPLKRQGLTPFTYSRFLVPWLCEYQGWALFMDADILVLGDVKELFACADSRYAVQVVTNPLRKFERASVMLFNCEKCKVLIPEYVELADKLHTLCWVQEDEIGPLPPEWNHLVGYDKPRADAELVHFTMGLPIYEQTKGSEYSGEWMQHLKWTTHAEPWETLMGPSVHTTGDGQGKRANLEAWRNAD
jgi:lipopolysaccharide biosynthesis glycosyltransferase